MDPTTTCCPNLAWPARGHIGQGNIAMQARQEQRFICHACHNTVSARTGTVCSRLRPAAEPVVIVVTVLAHGCPVHAMVAACGCDARTIAAWWARSGRHGHAVHASLVESPRDVGQVHAAALRVKQQGGSVWLARTMRVTTRVWLGGAVGEPRDLPLIRRLIKRVRRSATRRPLVICPDGLVSSLRARRETCRDAVPTGTGGRPRLRPGRQVFLAHVVTRDERRRVVETARRLVDGTPARVETLRRRSPGDGVIKTAYIERLHATCRERLAPLARRCRGLARQPLTRHEGMFLVGTV